MRRVELTEGERDAGEMPAHKRDEAARILREDGFVSIHNAVDPAICDRLYQGMMDDLDWLERHFGPLPKRGPDGWGKGNLNGFEPPRRREHLYREILYNPFAIAVTHALLGGPGMGVQMGSYVANWSFPLRADQREATEATERYRQQLHGDTGHLFPSMGEPEPPFMVNVSFPLVDFTEENGATEIWPGSHLAKPQLSDAEDEDEKQRIIERRRAERPPERMTAPKGAVNLRDPRGWHAGMPNFTDQIRIMVAMRHMPVWMRNATKDPRTGIKRPGTIDYEPDTEDLIGHEILEQEARFVDGADRNRLLDHLANRVPEALA